MVTALASSIPRALQWRNRYLLAIDAALLPLAAVLAFVARFEGMAWPAGMVEALTLFVVIAVPLKLFVFFRAGMYSRLWRYAGVADLERILLAAAAAAVVGSAVGAVLLPLIGLSPRVPLSVLVLDAVLTLALAAAPRLFVRLLQRRLRGRRASAGRRVLIAGAGGAGWLIAKELRDNPDLNLVAIGFVDDDRTKHGRRIDDVLVLGPLSSIESIARNHGVDEVIIAMPSAPGAVVREVVRAASSAGVPTRTVPGLYELISGRKSVSALRHVAIEDLLRRDPIRTDLEQVRRLATDRVVLVTGAGGSIGSELCRQLAGLRPRRLVALGRGENSIFELMQEVTRAFPEVEIVPVIADVRDAQTLREVFRRHRPYAVFHAAAHKHVPLMEQNPAEAVLNNVVGTENTVRLAAEFDAEHFVLVSTDKAVRPTSIMGATKRLAEAVVHDVSRRSGKRYVSVRFGNVLGSRGSVVPTFLRQIAAGGPVTVTHPEMRRYFMTIPEAVQLVLQAGALGEGSETFVLDMGEPVRIADLAADLIRLSGLEVGRDVAIEFTEMRPGEKLYEELFFSAECAAPTVHPKILRAKNVELEPTTMRRVTDLVTKARQGVPGPELRRLIKTIVPDYQMGPSSFGDSVGAPSTPFATDATARSVEIAGSSRG